MKRTYSTVADFNSAVRKALEADGRLTADQAKWLIERPPIAAMLAVAFDIGAKVRPTCGAVLRAAVVEYVRAMAA